MKQLYSPHWRHFIDSKQLYYILCSKISIKGWRESFFLKNHFSKERDEVENEKVLSEEIGHDGVSLIGGQGLAGKEAQPTEKTEARDLPQNTLLWPKVSAWHVTWNTKEASTSSEVKDASYTYP